MIIKDTIESLESEALAILKRQLRSSKTGKGLTPSYKHPKAKDTTNYNGTWPHWDLYDSGKFQDGITMKATDEGIVFNYRDSGAGVHLHKRIGDTMLQFNEESWNEFTALLYPKLREALHKEYLE